MPPMNPEDYLSDFVEQNFAEFADCDDVNSLIRKAFNAAIPASHFADCYFRYTKKHGIDTRFGDLDDFRRFADKHTNGAFNNIRSIADAYKHLYLGRTDASVSSAGSVEWIEFDEPDGSVDRMSNDYDEGAERSHVTFRTKDGVEHDFLKDLVCVVEFWRKLMGEGPMSI